MRKVTDRPSAAENIKDSAVAHIGGSPAQAVGSAPTAGLCPLGEALADVGGMLAENGGAAAGSQGLPQGGKSQGLGFQGGAGVAHLLGVMGVAAPYGDKTPLGGKYRRLLIGGRVLEAGTGIYRLRPIQGESVVCL